MSAELAPLTRDAARALTEEVKADAAALWSKLLQLYEGEAHLALGYSSWGEYYETEFGQSGRRGYQLLEAARVVARIAPVNNCSTPPPNEGVVRELAPVFREDPEQVEEVWAEVVEEHGPTPTAAQVREVVEDRAESFGVRKLNQQTRLLRSVAERMALIDMTLGEIDLDAARQATTEEERNQWVQQLRKSRTGLSRLIAAME